MTLLHNLCWKTALAALKHVQGMPELITCVALAG
jgi:hypothetical protein